MILNLLLTDPDNVSDIIGNNGFSQGNFGIIIMLVLIIITLIIVLTIVSVLMSQTIKDLKKQIKLLKEKNDKSNLFKEKQDILYSYQKLSKEEKQIIKDTIKTFNKNKDE